MSRIEIGPIEVLVLKKLVLINHALGQTLKGAAGREQQALARVLNEITLRADLANTITMPHPIPCPHCGAMPPAEHKDDCIYAQAEHGEVA